MPNIATEWLEYAGYGVAADLELLEVSALVGEDVVFWLSRGRSSWRCGDDRTACPVDIVHRRASCISDSMHTFNVILCS